MCTRDLERALLFGLIERPSRRRRVMCVLRRTALTICASLLAVLGAPAAAAFANTFFVSNNADSGAGSLRQAILDANRSTGADTITVAAGADTVTVTPLSPLPALTGQVLLNGQDKLTVNDSLAGSGANGLQLRSGSGNSTLMGLTILGSGGAGLVVRSVGNLIQGNTVGDSITRPSAPNRIGILIETSNNTIGGTAGGARNVISGNKGDGVLISRTGTSNNMLLGNYIGTTPAATGALPNAIGVVISQGATNNTIGGAGGPAGNLISGNAGDGVLITGTGTSGNVVAGNLIGTEADGATPLHNGKAGIGITSGATMNTIGGSGSAANLGNTIAFNPVAGVQVVGSGTSGDGIFTNSIFGNGRSGAGPGISLVNGANGNEPRPTITSVVPGPNGTMVNGTGIPASRIEVFQDPSCGDPEGKQFLGTVETGSGNTWTVSVPASTVGPCVTATQTGDNSHDTSPFSAGFSTG